MARERRSREQNKTLEDPKKGPSGPDLFWVGNDQLLEYTRKELLYDWTKLATQKGDDFALEQFAPGSVKNFKLEGWAVRTRRGDGCGPLRSVCRA